MVVFLFRKSRTQHTQIQVLLFLQDIMKEFHFATLAFTAVIFSNELMLYTLKQTCIYLWLSSKINFSSSILLFWKKTTWKHIKYSSLWIGSITFSIFCKINWLTLQKKPLIILLQVVTSVKTSSRFSFSAVKNEDVKKNIMQNVTYMYNVM